MWFFDTPGTPGGVSIAERIFGGSKQPVCICSLLADLCSVVDYDKHITTPPTMGGFLELVNTQKILTLIWHQILDKNNVENICHWNYFQIPQARFQSYQLTGPANSASKAG